MVQPTTTSPSTAYIALGSNLSAPQQQVELAVTRINQTQGCQVLASSPWYQSRAIGPGDQPDYINGVIKITTYLAPLELMNALQTIENRHHRKRDIHWGPRTLDLDILLIDNLKLQHPRLTLPHPHMTERNFVLQPLYDIAKDLVLPDGRALRGLMRNCSTEGLKRL